MRLSTTVLVGCVRFSLSIGLIGLLAAATGVGLHFARHGGRLLTVQTASMQPLVRPGDAVVVWPKPESRFSVGDIVSYHSLRDPQVIVSHRIVSVDVAHRTLVTQGDALAAPDPAIRTSAVIGQVTAVAPGLGHLLSWLRTPLGLTTTLYMPATLIIVSRLRRHWRPVRTKPYRLATR